MLLQYQSQNALPFRERCKSIGCAFGAHYVVDGTWNTVNDNTNVWRLKSLVADTSKDGRKQHVYYSTGVGTTFGSPIGGGMLSYGLNDEIIRVYEWLIDNHQAGDQLFIFGFSRGAYTARSLSGLIAVFCK